MKNIVSDIPMRNICISLLKAIIISLCTAVLFYDHVLGIIPGAVVGAFFFKRDMELLKQKRQDNILLQFKVMITSLSSALAAGYSLENAFLVTRKDMMNIYEKNEPIMRELSLLEKKLGLNIEIEDIIFDMSERYPHEEIRDFARILSTIKKTGGNTIEIIKRTVENISSKIDIKEEISVMIAAKRLEQKIMTYMPMILLFYLRITNAEYVERLYGNPGGILVMSGAIAMILFADCMGRKIINIKI